MVLLLWCVCGGLLLFMLEANYLSILVKPTYEKAIDTSEDVLDRRLTVLRIPGSATTMEMFKNSPSKITREIAESSIVPEVIFCYIEKFPF